VPAEEPVTPAEAVAVQANVVPAIVLVIGTLVVVPEQIVCATALAKGRGLTVTVTVALVQPLATAVTE
jgi:hypothetical protein